MVGDFSDDCPDYAYCYIVRTPAFLYQLGYCIGGPAPPPTTP
jgi:hypothetical protein